MYISIAITWDEENSNKAHITVTDGPLLNMQINMTSTAHVTTSSNQTYSHCNNIKSMAAVHSVEGKIYENSIYLLIEHEIICTRSTHM